MRTPHEAITKRNEVVEKMLRLRLRTVGVGNGRVDGLCYVDGSSGSGGSFCGGQYEGDGNGDGYCGCGGECDGDGNFDGGGLGSDGVVPSVVEAALWTPFCLSVM